jgi:hypothetical protein
MNKSLLILSFIGLAACGAIGIGSNDSVNVYNSSDDFIIVQGDRGMSRVAPNSSALVSGKSYMQINSKNPNCNSASIPKEANAAAILLDIIPGLLLGIIPIVVDAATGNLSTMPANYTYACI